MQPKSDAMKSAALPSNVSEYISGCSPEVRAILKRIRAVVGRAAPEAEERISYRMPAYFQNGVLIYFAAFKNHIGLYPPVRGDKALERAAAVYAGEKGNLKFPLSEPIPYALIGKIVKARLKLNKAKASTKRQK